MRYGPTAETTRYVGEEELDQTLVKGPQGVPGPAGRDGTDGADGPPGPAGPVGPPGVDGLQGPAGPSGATGPAGPAGAQGAQGVAGEKGDPGPIGPAGLNWQGLWSSGTSYVEDDAVGYEGASYFCINATSGTDPVTSSDWALLAAQGAKGDPGQDGGSGTEGPVGPTGPQGPAGVQGPEGPRGEKGETGQQGDQGSPGLMGPQGETGPQGIQGEPGTVLEVAQIPDVDAPSVDHGQVLAYDSTSSSWKPATVAIDAENNPLGDPNKVSMVTTETLPEAEFDNTGLFFFNTDTSTLHLSLGNKYAVFSGDIAQVPPTDVSVSLQPATDLVAPSGVDHTVTY